MHRSFAIALVSACHASHGGGVDGTSGGPPGTWASVAAPGASGKLTSVHGSSASDIWIAGSVVLHGDGATWSAMPGESGAVIFGFSAADVWLGVSCCKMIDHWDGSSWSAVAINDNRMVTALWGNGSNDVWATEPTPGYLGHWDGTTWNHTVNIDGVALWGTPTDTFAADASGVLHWTGVASIPSSDELTASGLGALSGTAVDDVWAAGQGGAIFHRDASGWSPVTSPTSATLRGLAAVTRDAAWAVGDGGTILYFDGRTWQAVASPTTNDLYAVWAAAADDVWAVGDGATVLHMQ